MAKQQPEYSAPQITEHRELAGLLQFDSEKPVSDASVKHGVRAYDAPAITGRDSLRASLVSASQDFDSDAEIKHNIEPVAGYAAPTISAQQDLEGGLAIFASEER